MVIDNVISLASVRRWLLGMVLVLSVLVITACDDNGDSNEEVPPAEDLRTQTIDILQGLSSVAFHVTHPNEPTDMGNGLTLTSVDGVASFPNQADMTAEGAVGRVNVTFGIVQIGDTTYMRGPIGDRWSTIDPSSLPFDFKGMNNSVADALTNAENIQSSAGAAIDGTETWVLHGNITSDDLTGLVPAAASGLPLEVSVWVRRSDGLPIRVVLQGAVIEADPETIVRHLDLSEFNEPVTIEPPI